MKKITPEQIMQQINRRLQADRIEAKAIADMTGNKDTYGAMLEDIQGVVSVLGWEPWKTMFDSVLQSAISERERQEAAEKKVKTA